MIRQAVIIAGGFGTRLAQYKQNIPKCLNKIGERSLLDQSIKTLSKSGIETVHLLLGHQADLIIREIEPLEKKYHLQITFSIEKIPMGTGGSLISNLFRLDREFIVIYGDLYIDTELTNFLKIFENKEADFAQLIHPTNHMHDSDLVLVNKKMQIVEYALKPHSEFLECRNLANSGIYAFKKSSLLEFKDSNEKFDLDKELLPKLVKIGKKGIGVRNYGYIRDAGTQERIASIEEDYSVGLPKIRRKPAIFLDRDGTLNRSRGYITNAKDIELYSDVPSAIKAFNSLGYWVIVITNQPVIARGEATMEDIQLIHSRIDKILSESGAYIDEYFVCPHHPNSGFPGEVTDLKVICSCRKPEIGLLIEAESEFQIAKKGSIFVGDSDTDMTAAHKFNIEGILICRPEEQTFTKKALGDTPRIIQSLTELVENIKTNQINNLKG